MERTIQKLEQTTTMHHRKKRVAAYARVSSGKDAMLHSLSAQVSYFSEFIQNNPKWEYAGVYADEAMTGTKDNREEFQRLLSDCRAGKVDMVITKSISRFARNTVTMLQTVRELKALNIDVFFEKENTHSISGDGELMLTVLASFAQEESLSVSENCKWRIRKKFEQGKLNTMRFMYGYDCMGDAPVIIPEEADIVSMIFNDYLNGMGKNLIMKKLNAAGITTQKGNRWSESSIACVLHNEKYCGNYLLQKTFSENHITKKKKINHGELPMYFARETHEAIIEQTTFDRVQAMMAERARHYNGNGVSTRYPFSSMIRCGICGKSYRRKTTYTGATWVCSTYNVQGKTACASKQIPENTLMILTASALGLSVFDQNIFKNKIDHILVPEANKVIFIFKSGTKVESIWQDRSRSESWTAEMRQKVSDRERKKKRC